MVADLKPSPRRDEAIAFHEKAAAAEATVKALREKIELQEKALDDLCNALNEERATVASLQEELRHARKDYHIAMAGAGSGQ